MNRADKPENCIDFDQIKKQLQTLPSVDESRMRLDRLNRLQQELQKRDIGGM